MKVLFPLCLIGALLGGFPGAFLAFVSAAGFGGPEGETICCITNVILSVCGALCGMLWAKAIQDQPRIKVVEVVLPVCLGLICGIAGYMWLDWAISHAD